MSEETGSPVAAAAAEAAEDTSVQPIPPLSAESSDADPLEPRPPVPAEPEIPVWWSALDEAPVEDLRKHTKFWGIVGSELEARRTAWEAEQRGKAEAAERERLEQEMVQLAREDPDAFRDRFLKDYEDNRQQQGLASLHSEARAQIARQVGQALRGLPEWQDLTPADHEEFFKALAGKSDDEIVATFNTTAVSKVAEVKAKRLVAQWQQTEREKERAAIRAEEQAKLLVSSDRPDTARIRGSGAISDEPNWKTHPAEWERWYDRNYGVGAVRR